MVIRLMLVDSHEMVREGLRTLLTVQPGLAVVAEAAEIASAPAPRGIVAPDVIIIAIDVTSFDDTEAVARLVAQYPGIPVIVLSVNHAWRFVVALLAAGASGYVTRSADSRTLIRAIHAVAQGRTYVCPELTKVAVGDAQPNVNPYESIPVPELSQREREVARLVAKGYSSEEIAQAFHSAVATVDVHRRNIMHKLGLHNVAALTRYAIKEGLISLECA